MARAYRKRASSPLDALEAVPRRSRQEVLRSSFEIFLQGRADDWIVMINEYLDLERARNQAPLTAFIDHAELVLDRLQWLADSLLLVADADLHRWMQADLPTLDLLLDAERAYGASPDGLLGLQSERAEMVRQRRTNPMNRSAGRASSSVTRGINKQERQTRTQARREAAAIPRRAKRHADVERVKNQPPRAVAVLSGTAPGLRNLDTADTATAAPNEKREEAS